MATVKIIKIDRKTSISREAVRKAVMEVYGISSSPIPLKSKKRFSKKAS